MLTISDTSGRQLLRLTVEIAWSQQDRARGLQGVTHLNDDQGMVFEFPAMTYTAFWMKDTVIPLDIAFWTPDGTIVDTRSMQPCSADPCPLYTASQAYNASVEVAGGLLARSRVEKGDHVVLSS